MRNALICAGTMFALLLLWPILFGGAAVSTASANAADGSTVTMRIPAPVPVKRVVPPPAPPATLAALPSLAPRTETCRASLIRARRLCAPGDAACTGSALDAFDVCEARGMWPS